MQVTFHGIAAGGDGAGRDADGRTVFAPFAAPGDIAQVEIEEERKNFARGKIIHLETASPQRIAPPCRYYLSQDDAPSCGGCQIQHLNYQAQLDAKTQLVRDALTRVGGFDAPPVEDCLPSPQEFGYRNKAQFFVGDDGTIGFHARRTHHVVDIEKCPLVQAPINDVLITMRHALRENVTLCTDVQSFRARVDSRGQIALEIVWKDGASSDKKAFFTTLRQHLPALIDPHQQKLEEHIGDLKFQLGAFDFFQVNSSLTLQLVQTALQMAAIKPGGCVLDLFCGAGLFAVFMARERGRVDGVDLKENLGNNARLNGLKARGIRYNAARFLQRTVQNNEQYDAIVLDPPREGAADCLKSLVQLTPRLVYVSCAPATLARDAKFLAAHNFSLQRAAPLDMFPQTAHVETVALFEKLGNDTTSRHLQEV